MSTTTDPADGFDTTIHAPLRLKVCAMLSAADQVEFGTAQEQLQVSASVLSKHVGVLMDKGYLRQSRATRERRRRVWLSLTEQGRSAYEAHVAALRAIVEG